MSYRLIFILCKNQLLFCSVATCDIHCCMIQCLVVNAWLNELQCLNVVLNFVSDERANGAVFHNIILTIIQKAHDIGLHVISVTSDMGSSNRAMWTTFGIRCTKDRATVASIAHPIVPGRKLFFLADVPHIIKNLKSALIRQDIVWNGEKVNVEPIKELAKLDSTVPLKLAPKLKLHHLATSHFDKMKVSSANHVISNSVSAGLCTMIEQKTMPLELRAIAKSTSEFVATFNRWFDLMCSRHQGLALSKFNMEKFQSSINFLRDIQLKVRSMQIGKVPGWKPLQTGIILTTQSVLEMVDELLTNENDFLMTGRLTQDCLDSLFSTVRLKTPTPMPVEFRNSLKIIAISQYL